MKELTLAKLAIKGFQTPFRRGSIKTLLEKQQRHPFLNKAPTETAETIELSRFWRFRRTPRGFCLRLGSSEIAFIIR